MSKSKKNTSEDLLRLQIASGGQDFIFGTGAAIEKRYQLIQVHDDAVFSALIDDAGNDLLADITIDGGLGIGSNTIKSGFIFAAKEGRSIASVTLTSGSVIGIL